MYGKRQHRNRNGQSPTKHSRTNNRTSRRETEKNENDLWRRNRQRRRKPAKNLHYHRNQRKRRRSKTSNRKNQRRRGKKRQTTGNPTSTQVQHKLQILPGRNVQVWKQMQLHTRRRTGHLTKNTRNTSRNNMETPGQTQNTIQQRGKKQIQFQQFRIQRSTQLETKK